jgi:hypothetical protein
MQLRVAVTGYFKIGLSDHLAGKSVSRMDPKIPKVAVLLVHGHSTARQAHPKALLALAHRLLGLFAIGYVLKVNRDPAALPRKASIVEPPIPGLISVLKIPRFSRGGSAKLGLEQSAFGAGSRFPEVLAEHVLASDLSDPLRRRAHIDDPPVGVAREKSVTDALEHLKDPFF